MINRYFLKQSVCLLLLLFTLAFFSSCSKTPEQTLEGIAKEAQKNCPLVMDQMTSMVAVEALPNMTLKYTYSSKQRIELTDEEKEKSMVVMKNILLGRLKIRQELPFYQANNVTFKHIFLDKEKHLILQVNIDPVDYQ